MSNFNNLRTMVLFILQNAHLYEWSVQGFGMMRLHLPDNCRLHLWHKDLRTPNVSDIHDHLQWGLDSTVITGSINNYIYSESLSNESADAVKYQYVTLKPGYGTKFKTEVKERYLRIQSTSMYLPRETYSQAPSVIHRSIPSDGTITMMRKHPTEDESARVFWPVGEEWVTAEPRTATVDEIYVMSRIALAELKKQMEFPS